MPGRRDCLPEPCAVSASTAALTATGRDEGSCRLPSADSRPRSQMWADPAGRSAQNL